MEEGPGMCGTGPSLFRVPWGSTLGYASPTHFRVILRPRFTHISAVHSCSSHGRGTTRRGSARLANSAWSAVARPDRIEWGRVSSADPYRPGCADLCQPLGA